MRTTILKTIILGTLAAGFFSGCGMGNKPVLPSAPKTQLDNGVIKVEQNVNKFSDTIKADSNFLKFAIAYKKGLKSAFDEAANKTLESGNTHFILLSKGSNGLKGFPLNTINDVAEYCLGRYLTDKELKNKCKKEGLISFNNGYVNLSVFPLKNPNYTIASFDAKEVLKEEVK
jgi:hypothetical protein